MSAISEISRIRNAKIGIGESIKGKGVSVPVAARIDEMPALIDRIPQGAELPELDNPGTAADLMHGKELIGGSGDIVTGSFSLDNEVRAQEILIQRIRESLQGKVGGGGITPSGTIEISENGEYDVTGYAIASVSVESGGDNDLPEGYTQVDFIELNGEQLVDLLVKGNQDTRITCAFTWSGSTQNHVFGCASDGNTASITSYMNGSFRFGAKSATKTIQKNNDLLPCYVRMDKTMIGVTSSNTTISGVEDFETPGTLLLGGARNSEGDLPTNGIVGRILHYNQWQGAEQILKLVSVVSAEGVYRFYDKISKTFFDSITDTPLGGGNF
jgi:hypothetical protein